MAEVRQEYVFHWKGEKLANRDGVWLMAGLCPRKYTFPLPQSRGGEWVAFKLRTTPGTKIRGSVNYFTLFFCLFPITHNLELCNKWSALRTSLFWSLIIVQHVYEGYWDRYTILRA
jgi:hypothetical protein